MKYDITDADDLTDDDIVAWMQSHHNFAMNVEWAEKALGISKRLPRKNDARAFAIKNARLVVAREIERERRDVEPSILVRAWRQGDGTSCNSCSRGYVARTVLRVGMHETRFCRECRDVLLAQLKASVNP